MKKLFIGLDVSKDVFDFCALNDLGEQESSKKVFQNSKQGIDQFCKSLKIKPFFRVGECRFLYFTVKGFV